MKTDEIIAMAKEAGMEVHASKGQIRIGSAVLTGCDSTAEVNRHTALVEAKVREACAQACEAVAAQWGFHMVAPSAAHNCAKVIRAIGQEAGE